MLAKGLAFAVLLLTAAPAAAQLAPSSTPPPGALACSGCHPPSAAEGLSVSSLQGRPAEELVSAMQGFRSGQRPATVMDRIAKGFTEEEIRAIALWYAGQTP